MQKALILICVLLLIGGCGKEAQISGDSRQQPKATDSTAPIHAKGYPTEASLTKALIAVLRSKDSKKHKEMYHPKCLEMINEDNKYVCDGTLYEYVKFGWDDDKCSIAVHSADDYNGSKIGLERWLIKPTHYIVVTRDMQPGGYATTPFPVCEHEGGWHLVFPKMDSKEVIEVNKKLKAMRDWAQGKGE